VWIICDFPIIALPSFVNVPSIADSADFDSCARLDKNHAPVTDPQPGAWPPCQTLDVTRSSFGKPLDLGLYVGPHVRRKFAKLAAGIMSPCDRLHEHNISNRDDPGQQNIATRDIHPFEAVPGALLFATEAVVAQPIREFS
jgi:hypothetical protein